MTNSQLVFQRPKESLGNLSRLIRCVSILFILLLPASLLGAVSPQFIFEAPEALEPLVNRLKETNPASLQHVVDIMGLQQSGPPIRVILAPNESPLAREAPEWMSGYALGQDSTMVLFTDRTSFYPNDSLHKVFLHEMAHILTHRAAGGHPLPRWFDEGLAMMAARTWDLEDRARLVWAMVSTTEISLDELNSLFVKDDTLRSKSLRSSHTPLPWI